MRVMARDALARGTGMLHLCCFDLLSLVFVAGQAERPAISVRQDDLSFFGRLVAAVAHLAFERSVQEGLHQLRLCRLVGVVALQAVGGSERLILMRLLQRGIFHVMAIDAKRGDILFQVGCELDLSLLTVLMSEMAGVAPHIERRVPAAFFGNVNANLVA